MQNRHFQQLHCVNYHYGGKTDKLVKS